MADTATVRDIVEPFVEEGIYSDREEVLKNLRDEFIDQKIRENQREIEKFREKYGRSFEEFTENIEGEAKVDEEDDWIRWEAARNMMEKWKKVGKE